MTYRMQTTYHAPSMPRRDAINQPRRPMIRRPARVLACWRDRFLDGFHSPPRSRECRVREPESHEPRSRCRQRHDKSKAAPSGCSGGFGGSEHVSANAAASVGSVHHDVFRVHFSSVKCTHASPPATRPPGGSESTARARLVMMFRRYMFICHDYAISSPRIVPFDVANASASIPSRWSIET